MMHCPVVPEDLLAYADDCLSAAERERERVETHLASCAACADEVAALSQTLGLLRKLPDRPLPDDLRNRLVSNLQAEAERMTREAAEDSTVVTRLAKLFRQKWKIWVPTLATATIAIALFAFAPLEQSGWWTNGGSGSAAGRQSGSAAGRRSGNTAGRQSGSATGGPFTMAATHGATSARMTVARLSLAAGSVTINGKNLQPTPTGAALDIALAEGDQLAVRQGSNPVVTFPDGSTVALAAGSRSKVYGNWLHLDVGQGWFEIAKQEDSFQASTPTAMVTVLGTIFRITATAKGATTVDLREGAIRFETRQGSQLLAPGQTAAIRPDGQYTVKATTGLVPREPTFDPSTNAPE